jgi:hypothetical protein
MGKQVWLASLFTLIVVGALLGGPLGAAAQTPAVAPTLPPGSLMNCVWVSSANDVFVVGYDGASGELILHYNGSAWSTMSKGTTAWLNGVWGSSGSDVFAVGAYGRILHYDGNAWSRSRPMGVGITTLITIRGTSNKNILAVGENGTILHYDGNAWSVMNHEWPVQPMPTHADRRGMGTLPYLLGVWASSDSDAFAVGDFGTILHYDGKAWTPMSSGTKLDIVDVWGSSASDVFAVGDGGTVLHYDGKAWSPMNGGTSKSLSCLWSPRATSGTGNSGSDVFTVGKGGAILHYDGKAWSPMSSGTSTDLNMVWGSSGADVWAVGGEPVAVILHYDGSAWSVIASGSP